MALRDGSDDDERHVDFVAEFLSIRMLALPDYSVPGALVKAAPGYF